MSDVVIQIDNLAKKYDLGVIGSSTLKHDLNRWWHQFRGRGDNSLTVDSTKKSSTRSRAAEGHADSSPDELWALRDISLEVRRGEILGVIGRNGAGKSTLLKILSRTTAPTRGEVRVKGRIASLLEVGTGFHPDLTGRENIFLNGAILGMSHREIRRKLDEIVDFSEVERFIDTPVKRYSSGMYVRLAFAVAAHLEPEILIVDEVLAVGDAQFQKKCIGKMQSVADSDGRTVLFVSHSMAAIQSLCTQGLYLKNGRPEYFGDIKEAVDSYIRPNSGSRGFNKGCARMEAQDCDVLDCWIESDGNRVSTIRWDEEFELVLEITVHSAAYVSPEFLIRDSSGVPILFAPLGLYQGFVNSLSEGSYRIRAKCQGLRLASGTYRVDIMLADPGKRFYAYYEMGLEFEMADMAYGRSQWHFTQRQGQGWIPLSLDAQIESINE